MQARRNDPATGAVGAELHDEARASGLIIAAASGEHAYPLELMSQADGQLYRAKITRNAVGAPTGVLPCGPGSVPAAGRALPHPVH